MECSHRTFWLPGCLQMPLPFSLETKSPPDNRSGLWTAFFPSQLRADSYLPHHPEQDFTGNTDPSNKSKRAVMIFFLNFSLYNKEAPKDKLNLISGLSNLDTTKKKKKGGGGNQWLTWEHRSVNFQLLSLTGCICISLSIWHFIDSEWKTELCTIKLDIFQCFSSCVSVSLCYSLPLPCTGGRISSNSPNS